MKPISSLTPPGSLSPDSWTRNMQHIREDDEATTEARHPSYQSSSAGEGSFSNTLFVGGKVLILTLCTCAQSCPTLCDPMDGSSPGSSVHGIFQARNTGVGFNFLFRGIFQTQGSNPHLLHRQTDSLPLHHRGSPDLNITALFYFPSILSHMWFGYQNI